MAVHTNAVIALSVKLFLTPVKKNGQIRMDGDALLVSCSVNSSTG